MPSILIRALRAFALLALPACTIQTNSDPAAGALGVSWTLESSASPSECDAHGASSISLQLFDATGKQYGATTSVACSLLSTQIGSVPVGSYTLKGELLDVNGVAVTSVDSAPVTISQGVTTNQAFDFPTLSFIQPGVTTGALDVTWTIASGTDPAEWAANGAVNVALSLTDVNGASVGNVTTAACTSFTATLSGVAPGSYGLDVTMLDANGAAVSSEPTVSGVAISAGATTTQSVDFPLSSFVGGTTSTGSLEVDWTIASASNPADCDVHGAQDVSLQLYDASGTPLNTPAIDPCGAFSVTLSALEPGAYQVSAVLVDGNQTPVSTRVPPQPFTITANTTTQQRFDFPSSSFLQ